MNKLEKTLADTFCAARWDGNGGKPVCRECFDGKDLVEERRSQHTNTWARRFRCRPCGFRFSDLLDTPLAGTQKPLAVWALLVLLTPSDNPHAPSFEALTRLTGVGRQRLADMETRLRPSAMIERWRRAMRERDITPARLFFLFPEDRRKAFNALAFDAKGRSIHARLASRRAACSPRQT